MFPKNGGFPTINSASGHSGSRGLAGSVRSFCSAAASVNGTLVMAPGDLNLTFKRYLETPIRLTIEDDYVVVEA